MRINVQGLPLNQDFPAEFEIPAASFVDQKTDPLHVDPIFLTPVHCHVTLRKAGGDEVFMTFTAKTLIEPICNRCTEAFQIPFAVESFILCKPMTRSPTEEEEEDEGLVFFNKQEIYLADIIREQVLLALPMQYVCDENCQGLCPGCGINLNDGEHECPKRPKFIEHKAKVL